MLLFKGNGGFMKIYSWNVNGIRALDNKGMLSQFIATYQPDILCIQETKAQPEQIDYLLQLDGYYCYQMSAIKKGYSGVLVYTKTEPLAIANCGANQFDDEGRYIELTYDDFTLINCYFPNSQEKGKRIDYKIDFNNLILNRCQQLTAAGIKVIVTGDYNVAHNEIDLKNPKTNHNNPGFLPAERQWMTEFLDADMIDTFRYLHPEDVKYSWWSYRFSAREKNIGWRIDYFCINNLLQHQLVCADILDQVTGSDHCPIVIELDI